MHVAVDGQRLWFDVVDAIPDVRLEVLAGAGHWAWLDVPERYRELLVGAIEDSSPASGDGTASGSSASTR